MIGGLQGDFGDLDIKYLKQNISKCRSQISGSFRRTPRHCAKCLWNYPGKRYQRIRICLTEEVETPSFPIRICLPDVKYPEKVERHPDRIPDVGYPEKMERRKGDRPRVHGVGTPPPDDTECASLSGATPSGFPKRTRDALPYPEQLHPDSPRRHAALANITHPDDSISYPDMLSGSLSQTPCILDLLMAKEFKASVLHVSELSIFFAMDSKELSSISDCFGDQITNKKHQNLHNLIRIDCNGPWVKR